MHELAITQEIVDVVRQKAGSSQVTKVVIEIGQLAAILPEAVRTCFSLCIEGTSLKGATLEIRETPGIARCRACAKKLQLYKPYGACHCGCSDLEVLSGEALRIVEIEVI